MEHEILVRAGKPRLTDKTCPLDGTKVAEGDILVGDDAFVAGTFQACERGHSDVDFNW